MADMVSSAVVKETVSQILSGMMDKYECKSNAKENVERLEMAHMKLEAALEISEKWKMNNAPPLLRWRSKLKRATQECDDTLRKCKQRILEEEEMEQEVKNSSFPKRIAHTTKSFISSFFNGSSRCVVRRFEWYADSASDFLRFLELGGTPRQYMFLDPLVRHLLAGKRTVCKFARGNQHHLVFLGPFSTAEHGIEGTLKWLNFIHKNGDAPENDFLFSLTLQLSESTDIVGIAIKCLELFSTLHSKSTVDIVKMKLTQLPTQDFYSGPHADCSLEHHWNNLHGDFTQWFRPNPLCCKQHDQYKQPCGSSNANPSELLPCISLEPVIGVYLQGYIPQPACCNRRRTIIKGKTSSLQNKGFPYLKLGLLFSPHASSEDLLPGIGGFAKEMINGEEQHGLCANITLEQLGEIVLPKAIDCLRRNAGATAYQMIWKSKHASAYLQFEKTAMRRRTIQRTTTEGRRAKLWQSRQDELVESWTHLVPAFLDSWAAHAPARLQGSIMDLIQKERKCRTALAIREYIQLFREPLTDGRRPRHGDGGAASFDGGGGGTGGADRCPYVGCRVARCLSD